MRWVKQAVSYWCDDIKSGKCLGKGVTVAVLDTGLSAHPDLEGRTAGFRDFVGNSMKCSDDSGHGTHVAGILAGSGRVSDGLYAGMAPEASLLVGKVLDREGNGNVENVIAGIRWILEQKDRYGVRIVNISVGTQPDLGEYQKRRCGGVMGQWACGGSVRGKLRTGGGECGCARHKPQGNYSGGPGYGASARAETQEKCKLFRKGTDRGMCGKAGRVCPGDRSHKLQRQIRPSRRTSVHDENRHINGNPGSFRSGGVPAVQIPGYDKCRSEAAVKGSMRKAAGNRLRMGDAERGAAFK